MKRYLVLLTLCLPIQIHALEIHDGHIHYNADIWEDLSPQQAIDALNENNIDRAIVFSTPEEGTKKLYRLAPDRIIPFIRPYRVFRDRFSFHSDEAILEYVTREIETGFYQGLGEFHLFKEHKNTPVIQKMMAVVAKHNLAVSAHSDAETIEALINMQPQVLMIWAHCGMDHPVDDVKRMLDQYPNLYCELSFRDKLTDPENTLTPKWKTLLEQYPQRFMTGMDTYIARRWAHLPEIKDYADHWLGQLDPATAKAIAKDNINRLFPRK